MKVINIVKLFNNRFLVRRTPLTAKSITWDNLGIVRTPDLSNFWSKTRMVTRQNYLSVTANLYRRSCLRLLTWTKLMKCLLLKSKVQRKKDFKANLVVKINTHICFLMKVKIQIKETPESHRTCTWELKVTKTWEKCNLARTLLVLKPAAILKRTLRRISLISSSSQ